MSEAQAIDKNAAQASTLRGTRGFLAVISNNTNAATGDHSHHHPCVPPKVRNKAVIEKTTVNNAAVKNVRARPVRPPRQYRISTNKATTGFTIPVRSM